MSCWCNEVYNYICNDCKEEKTWRAVPDREKAIILSMAKALKENDVESYGKWLMQTDYMPSDIPKSVFS